jgi:hypothetical protein
MNVRRWDRAAGVWAADDAVGCLDEAWTDGIL